MQNCFHFYNFYSCKQIIKEDKTRTPTIFSQGFMYRFSKSIEGKSHNGPWWYPCDLISNGSLKKKENKTLEKYVATFHLH